MKTLRTYLNSLTPDEQVAYATRCETTLGYLRKALSTGEKLRETLCIALDKESDGKVRFDDLRPDVNWTYVFQRLGGRVSRKAVV